MQYGILMFPTRHPVDVAVVARQAEALGFDSLWVGEHPIMPVHSASPFPGSPDGRIPDSYSWFMDPFVTLARASAVTTKLKLGTGITLIPERNPLLLAKEIATLDYFSGGRFVFGIGAGWNKEETEIMGGDFTHRWAQTREAIEAMQALWANEAGEYHGTYYDFPLVRSFPRPVQQPHPPIGFDHRAGHFRPLGMAEGVVKCPVLQAHRCFYRGPSSAGVAGAMIKACIEAKWPVP